MKGDIPLFDLGTSLGTDIGSKTNEADALGINSGMSSFANPLSGAGLVGPGSHQEELVLNYMEMPKEMDTFDIPVLPESDELSEHPQAAAALQQLQLLLDVTADRMAIAQDGATEGGALIEGTQKLSLDGIEPGACSLLYQTLGEGEVALMILNDQLTTRLRVQETVLAGVWWIQQLDDQQQLQSQWLEVGAIPEAVLDEAFPPQTPNTFELGPLPGNLLNGASVVLELLEKAAEHARTPLQQPHVVNLSLLPFSPEDQNFLHQRLGGGRVAILSRGYGNCRIHSTAVAGVWSVQYFNSTDQLILDTLEVIAVPQVACAAREDLEDSAERLREIFDALMPAEEA